MLVIANTLAPNGGTTFLVRIAREYHQRKNKIKVIVLYNNFSLEHLNDLKKYADVIFIKDFGSVIYSFFSKSQMFPFIVNLKKRKLKEFIGNESTIHVMGIFGYILAKRIQKIIPALKITVGIYHQNEFKYESIKCFFNNWVFKEISRFNHNHIIFFNNNTRNTYAQYFNRTFINSTVIPIGIDLKNEITNFNNFVPNLIISVGNLVGFKTYNKHIINEIPNLIKLYPEVKYHIYGTGEEEINIKSLIKDLDLEEYVILKGILDYNKFNEVVSLANVFVGNGTAVLEAANLSVPSIVGIESCEDPITYGYISDIEEFDYNEFIINKRTIKFNLLLENLFSGGKDERKRLGKLNKIAVEKFDISNTVLGFDKVNKNKEKKDIIVFRQIVLIKLLFSFIYISIFHLTKIDCRFKYRRNQG